MALACLGAQIRKNRQGAPFALIVDHGLRPGAADEAAQARDWCEALGLPAQILHWRGEKPATGVQAAARAARYRLLAEAAVQHGAASLLTAHSADDQAETLLMRLQRGAGLSGLSAMAQSRPIAAGAGAPVTLLRPFLDVSRARLTATVRAFDQPFLDDPSNDDMNYERVRMRALLAEAAGLVQTDAIAASAARLQSAARASRAFENDALARLAGIFTCMGCAQLSLDQIHRVGAQTIPAGLIARLIRAVSGVDHRPAGERAEKAFEEALDTGAASLGGALIKKQAGMVHFFREPGAITGRTGVEPLREAALAPGVPCLFDGRFIISVSQTDCVVRPLGEEGLAALGENAVRLAGPRQSLLALPGVFRRSRLIGAPGRLFPDAGEGQFRPLAEERFFEDLMRFS